ncbi:MAG: UDP-N-acetylmuramoyl-L-alanine--D-glutamate ligase [Bacilli bacterium]|jgi:UDP-N-acetylmuramoylalanine--D-glutamate ligase
MIFTNKKIFILGMARSGYEAAKVLSRYNNNILLYDDNKQQDEAHIKELQALGVNLIFEGQPDDILTSEYDYIIKNPGVPLDHKYVKMAEQYNIPIINEVEMAYHLFPKDITIIGITGTNGKTTTTTLIYEMLKRAGWPVHLTGNIGFPLCGFIDKVKSKDIIVMEVSIQQLVNLNDFNAHIVVMTNLFEAHTDFVGSYDNYLKIKSKIFKNHTNYDIAILNKADDTVLELTKYIKSTKKYFSSREKIEGSYLLKGAIYYNDEKIINTEDIRITGMHNYENIMAAIVVAKEYQVNNKIIKEFLEDFAGVEHRQEFVAKINGITFYNDSKATNIVATQTALKSFIKPTILILGGMERNQNFHDLTDYMTNVKQIVCYGETKNRIKEFASEQKIDCIVVDNLEEATNVSYKLANDGDIVLFSPACASWDQYKSFEERGERFKEYVNKLVKE